MAKRFASSLISVSLVSAAILVGWFMMSKHWQVLEINEAWFRSSQVEAKDLSELLDRYRLDHGEYPARLPPELTDERSSSDWWYLRISPNEYQLARTTLHFVSSFDAIVFRSSGNYPNEWESKRYVRSINGWKYVLGAQKLVPLGEPMSVSEH